MNDPRRESGFSVLEVLIGASIFGMITWGMYGLLQNLNQQNSRNTIVSKIRMELALIEAALKSTSGWDETINHASNNFLDCIRPNASPTSDCTATLDNASDTGSESTFLQTIYNASGNGILFQVGGVNSFNFNGELVSGGPIQVRFWIYEIGCSGSPCQGPAVVIESKFQFLSPPPQNFPALNLNNYRIRVVKDGFTDISQLCASIGGTFQQGSPPKCEFQQDACNDLDGDGAADPGLSRYMVGFDEDWNVLCSSDQCPTGYILQAGFTSNGSNSSVGTSNTICTAAPSGSLYCGGGGPLTNERMLGIERHPNTGEIKPLCTLEVTPQATPCGAGYVARGINHQGIVQCVPHLEAGTDCGNTEVLQGVNPDGTKNCAPRGGGHGIGPNTCGADEVVEGINPNGTPKCKPAPGPKNCHWVYESNNYGPFGLGHFIARCPSGYTVFGGGGFCLNASPFKEGLRASEPLTYTSNYEPLDATGEPGVGWHVMCVEPTTASGNAKAFCCQL